MLLSKKTLSSLVLLTLAINPTNSASAESFQSIWHQEQDRIWVGEDFWANPMEDWRIEDGILECVRTGGNRNVQSLVAQIKDGNGEFELRLEFGLLETGKAGGTAGFRLGIQSEFEDYLHRVFHGKGIDAGISTDGHMFIGRVGPYSGNPVPKENLEHLVLVLKGTSTPADQYTLTLSAIDPKSNNTIRSVKKEGVPSVQLSGNIALVNNHHTPARRSGKSTSNPQGFPGTSARFGFHHFSGKGNRIVVKKDQRFGPILFAQYTLSRNILKLTAQFPPLGKDANPEARLEIKSGKGNSFSAIAASLVDPESRTATFRIENWDSTRDVPYRIAYEYDHRNGDATLEYFQGTIRKEPRGRPLVVAGFTGHTDPAFPNRTLVRNVGIHDPDVLFFSGDQIYENVGGFGIHREPVDLAIVNYLRKWIMHGWAFRDLMRDRPSLCLPDDHDVYQGNIWGAAGEPQAEMSDHDKGGYRMHPNFVNAVQRTHNSHHPDPFDPTPVKQGIGVYYGDMLYGKVSFAIEDRKFKDGPKGKVNTWPGRSDHVKDPKIDIAALDLPGLNLLGKRQLHFLDQWGKDWKGADLKVVLSQTIFCNLANYHGGNKEYLIADLDSNGWPQSGRHRAVEAMRKAYALHLAGDQHLPSIVHHGLEEHRDSGFSFCVPSIAAGYPRSWKPDEEGQPIKNRPAKLPNTGDYIEGLGNKVTVHAIGNPAEKNRPGIENTLHDKSSGYGILRCDPARQTFTMECWKLQFDAKNPRPEDQFPGWPMTVSIDDQYGRKAVAHLPTLKFVGLENPVVQVIKEPNGETVYTRRVMGTSFRPKIFDTRATYTLIAGNPQKGDFQTYKSIKPGNGELTLKF
jgi:alkaline phosphatase D